MKLFGSKSLSLLLACWLLMSFTPSYAEIDLSQQQQHRWQDLTKQIKCVVCQNQSIFDSGAAAASEMKHYVAEQIALGESDQQIKEFMVSRYGQQVLLTPPINFKTWGLWFGPVLILILAGLYVAPKVKFK